MKTFIFLLFLFACCENSFPQINCNNFFYSASIDQTSTINQYIITKSSERKDYVWKRIYTDSNPNFNYDFNYSIDDSCNIDLVLTQNGQEIKRIRYNDDGNMLWIKYNDNSITENSERIKDNSDFNYHTGWPIYNTWNGYSITQSININSLFSSSYKQLTLCIMNGPTTSGTVYGWQHDGTSISGWPIINNNEPALRGASMFYDGNNGFITYGQADNSNAPNIHIKNNNANEINGWPKSFYTIKSPVFCDLNNDGQMDVISISNAFVYAWSGNGNLLPNFPVNTNSPLNGIAVGDVNRDGNIEIVATSFSLVQKRVLVLSSGGQILYDWTPQANIVGSQNNPVLADLDNNGDLEILICGYDDILAWKYYGPDYWSRKTINYNAGQIAIGDIDNDGYLDIVTNDNSLVYAWNNNGNIKNGWPISINNIAFTSDSPEISGPVIGNIDNILDQEVLVNSYNYTVPYNQWYIYAFKSNGATANGFPIIEESEYTPAGSPLLSDIEGDNHIQLVSYAQKYHAGSYFKVSVFDLDGQYNSLYIDWPMLSGNPYRTGLGLHGGSLPNVKFNNFLRTNDNISNEFKLNVNYPNPFNPETKISFSLPVSSTVNLIIYNITGKELMNINLGIKSAGVHEMIFNGDNLPSGIYFYKLSAGNYSETKKMVLIK